jgi:hypothetical protein
MYAVAFFLSGVLPALVFEHSRREFFTDPFLWVPPTASILAAVLVVLVTLSSRISPASVLTIGLFFEVAGAFGIVAAESLDGSRYLMDPPWAGLSWVAVWVLGFAVIVPTPPMRALVAAITSAGMVPLVVGLVMATGRTEMRMDAVSFFFGMVLPYIVVVMIAYWSSRAIYHLGTQVTTARNMGSYRLTTRLGQGGMGEVWRAEHQLLARPAAVKLMRHDGLEMLEESRHAELHARFEREAQATALLRSPHTVELFDFGTADDGTWYYVMELLDGFDCGSLVERFGPLPPERVVYLLLQMCHSLGEAHAKGLIHRDIKPANIYVCRHGRDEDFVKVLDFGLVKGTAHDESTGLDLTQARVAPGTPAFMAPEQVLAKDGIDHRADIYATGCVAYWLTTGQRVFTGGSTIEVLMQHLQSTPIPASERVEGGVPAGLDRLILDCLAKEPAARPATADDLAMRLESLDLAPNWTRDRRQRWWQAHAPAKA